MNSSKNERCGICNSDKTSLENKKVVSKNTNIEYLQYYIKCHDCGFSFVNDTSELATTASRRSSRRGK